MGSLDVGCRAEEQAAAKEGAQAQSAKQHADKAAKEKAALQQGLTAAQAEVRFPAWRHRGLPTACNFLLHAALQTEVQTGCTGPPVKPTVAVCLEA